VVRRAVVACGLVPARASPWVYDVLVRASEQDPGLLGA